MENTHRHSLPLQNRQMKPQAELVEAKSRKSEEIQEPKNFLDKISFLQQILNAQEQNMRRIKNTQDNLLRNSIKGTEGEELKQNQPRNSVRSSTSNGRVSANQMRKVPLLRSPLFMQSDTDEADISDNGLRANHHSSHISMISPNQNQHIHSPLNRKMAVRRNSLSISASPAIVLKTPLRKGALNNNQTVSGENQYALSSKTSLKATPKSSVSRKDKLKQIQHNLFNLLQELDDNQSDTSGCSSPQKKKKIQMVDQEIQTDRKSNSDEGGKKTQKKRKSKRNDSGMAGVIAGGALAGALLGGIFFAVKIFSKENSK